MNARIVSHDVATSFVATAMKKKDLFNLIRAVEFAVNKNIFRAMLIESTRHQQF
jgi:hypothetical protein